MEYILQFADPEDADIIMGHVTKETGDGEVQITLLAAGMEPGASVSRDAEVFYQPQQSTPPSQPPTAQAQPLPAAAANPIQLDEIDLDIPTFLRRQRGG
jgi:cell division GTPase FtsZ